MVTTFQEKLKELFADAQATLKTRGFSWDTLSETLLTFIHEAMVAAKDELLNPGAEKKAKVLEWVSTFVDYVLTAMPLPTWLLWLKISYVQKAIKSILMTIASGLIEGLYTQNVEKFSA